MHVVYCSVCGGARGTTWHTDAAGVCTCAPVAGCGECEGKGYMVLADYLERKAETVTRGQAYGE